MTNELVEYVKGENGQLIGAVVAVKHEDSVGIGWSLCKTKGKNKDVFDKEKALLIARGRATIIRGKRNNLPLPIQPRYINMVERAKRYFKDLNILCEDAGEGNWIGDNRIFVNFNQ